MFSRAKKKKVVFSSLIFLKNLKKERFLWLKIRELLLLFIRIGFILLLILSLAGPTTKKEIFFLKPYGGVALIIDDTYSTQRCFEKIKENAAQFITKLNSKINIGVFTFSGKEITGVTSPQARKKVLQLSPSFYGGDGISAWRKALFFLKKVRGKYIFIFTDGEKKSLDFLNKINIPQNLMLYIIISGKVIEKNVGINDVYYLPRYPLPKEKIFPVAVLENKGSIDAEIEVSLHANGIVEKKKSFIPKGEKKEISFNTTFESIKGYIEISSDDVCGDNKRYFIFSPCKREKILIIKGSHNPFYLKNAVSPGGRGYELHEVSYKEFSMDMLKNYSLIILYTVPFTFVEKMINYWTKPLLIFCDYCENSEIKGILKGTTIRKVHKIVGIYEKNKIIKNPSSVYFKKYLKAKVTSKNIVTMLKFSNHDPMVIALKEKPVYIFFFIPDPSYTNFIYKPEFVILIQKILRKVLTTISKQNYMVGDTIRFETKKQSLLVETPVSSYRILSRTIEGKRYAIIENTHSPGFYKVNGRVFVVNVSPYDGYSEILSIHKKNVHVLKDKLLIVRDLTPLFLFLTFVFLLGEILLISLK